MHNNASDCKLELYSTAMCNLTSNYPTCLERRDGGFKLHPFIIVSDSITFYVRDSAF